MNIEKASKYTTFIIVISIIAWHYYTNKIDKLEAKSVVISVDNNEFCTMKGYEIINCSSQPAYFKIEKMIEK